MKCFLFSMTIALISIANLKAQSELEKCASSIKPGEWAELKTQNFSREMMQVPSNHYHIAGWTDDGVWDSQRKQFLFMGFRQGLKFISYSESTNTWEGGHPVFEWPLKSNFGHVYGNNAFDEKRGVYFHHISGGNLVYQYELNEKKWTELPPITGASGQLATGIEMFPEANCLLRHANDGLWKYDFTKKEWSKMEKTIVCGYHSLMKYNPIKKEVLFLGGSSTPNAVIAFDKDLKIKKLEDLPIPMNIRFEKLLIHPVTGHYLLFKDAELYDLNSDTGKYTKIDKFKSPFAGTTEMPVPATIYEHKVLMFVDVKVMLYKPEIIE